MLEARGPLLPHAWVAGDDELGRCSWFRKELRARGECYLVAVPSKNSERDLTSPEPPTDDQGRQRRVHFTRVDRRCDPLSRYSVQTVEVRDAWCSPVVVQV